MLRRTNRYNPTKRIGRRKMTWVALWAMIGTMFSVLFLVKDSTVVVTKEIISWFFTITGSIVGAYTGFSVLDDHLRGKKGLMNPANNEQSPPPTQEQS